MGLALEFSDLSRSYQPAIHTRVADVLAATGLLSPSPV